MNTDARTGKVKYASAHDLRQSFGERWAALVMPQILTQLMRHESIDTTMKFYVGRNAEKAADALWEAVEHRASRRAGASGKKSEISDSTQPIVTKGEKKMTRSGLEPETYGLKVRCSTN